MNCFKLGCNFDFALIDKVAELNKRYVSQITEFYGSERSTAWLAARPDFRLPDITRKNFKEFIKRCNDNKIIFNYTLNTIHASTKRELHNTDANLLYDVIDRLKDSGIRRITVASPLLLELIRDYDDKIEIEISTILHVDTVTQIKYLKEKYNVKKICNNLMRNRSVKFLKNAAKYCNENDIQLELMVNEFCGVGGAGYATHCVLRDSCYICHATNITKEDALLFENYPMGHCMDARYSDPYNWLRLRWVRPEDIVKYNSIGITNFKITGRTGTTDYIMKVAEAYVSQQWQGNLLDLWKPLETIYTGQAENEFQQRIFIDNNKLDGFIDHWFNDENFECSNELCGTTCEYCHKFYLKNNDKTL